MGKKHRRKHKHQHNNCNHECENGGNCGCHEKKNDEIQEHHLEITSERELAHLIDLIIANGKIKSFQRQQKEIDLGYAMMNDAGITKEDMTPPVEAVEDNETETAI